jgi:uncharacterized protein
MQQLIGRTEELTLIRQLQTGQKPAFLAVYGRRRVGKTFLVKQAFDNQFDFYLTGVANVTNRMQLANYFATLVQSFPVAEREKAPKDWFEAFRLLRKCLESAPPGRKVIFLDELPWFDTPKSAFVPALEFFWNSWASTNDEILLIVCGSAASWMLNTLINHRGGLHNRITHRLHIEPFTLKDFELYFKAKSAPFERYQLLNLFMVTGGIPYYMEQVQPNQSVAQNIDRLCYSKNGMLRTEFGNLYASLYKKPEGHVVIIETLARKTMGMSREELIQESKLQNGGNLTKMLNELEESGFIKKYKYFGNLKRNAVYRLSDFYSHFYLRFIKGIDLTDDQNWLTQLDDPSVRAWSGYAFEQICISHIPQIKKALGISSIKSSVSTWQGSDGNQKAQIDLLIDRRDESINLCEIKYSIKPYVLEKAYADQLRQKVGVFKNATETRKSVFLTFISTFGLAESTSSDLIHQSLTMDCLFE